MAVSNKSAIFISLAAALVVLSASPAFAVKGINADGSLDKPVISKAYFEGEFWTVINALEAFRKSDFRMNREDSIYTFKYLSVVYAAEPSTRLKAESYMYQLVRMMPTIDLLDLYISDNIQSIFMKVKSEFEQLESRTAAQAPGDTVPEKAQAQPAAPTAPPGLATAPAARQNPPPQAPAPAPSDEPKVKSKRGLKVWAPLALGGVGVATATYFLVSLNGESGSGKTARPLDVTMEWPKEGSP